MKPPGLNSSGKAVTVVVFMAFILFVDYIGLFNGANNYFYDLFFRLRGPGETAKSTAVIAIDDKTLEKLGRWPIRRLHYATLLKWLREADNVAFDIILAEPSADDAALEESIKQHGRVVFPLVIDDRMAIAYPVIASARDRVGHIHLEQGIDGVVREVYHTLVYKNSTLPSFSSIAFENATGKKFRRTHYDHLLEQKAGITQLDRVNINYCGGTGAFERISLSDVLEGAYPTSFFKNRICLVGITATGVSEILLTPFSQERKGMPGIEVHANILNNLLLGNAIHVLPNWIRWLAAICLTLFSFLWFLRMSEAWMAVVASLMLACVTVVAYLLFSTFNVWLAPSGLLFSVASIFTIAYVFKFNDAVVSLDKAYMTVTRHLRWFENSDRDGRLERGIRGLLTPGGVYSKAQILADMTDQLIFEKELTDSAIFSDVQGVLLFGPNRLSVLANNLASRLCKENAIDIGSMDRFMKDIEDLMVDTIDGRAVLEELDSTDHHTTFNVLFPSPEKAFFKIDASSLKIQGKRYPLFVFSDITVVKELEILKGHIVSLVSHEIRTPLISIQGFSEILFDALEGEMKEYAAIVEKESSRLIRFLNMFLDISRIEEGREPIRIASVTLPDVVKEVVRELGATGEGRGIMVYADIPERITSAMIDRDLTKQCLINLVENAIKYSPPDREVVVKLGEETEYIRIDIVDHGIGIREEEVNMVFEKFYRAHSDNTVSIPGSGLGLTFVREAVGAQGGKVSVKSRYGKGSIFSIILPKQRAKESVKP